MQTWKQMDWPTRWLYILNFIVWVWLGWIFGR